MKITLKNGKELTPIAMRRRFEEVQGAKRRTVSFVFPESEGMNTIDNAFTESACERISVVHENGNESWLDGYTIRCSISKAPVSVSSESGPATEERITVTMAQRTYMETKLAELSAMVTAQA